MTLDDGGRPMATRWAVGIIGLAALGCVGPRYTDAPSAPPPVTTTATGTTVAFIDARPKWEKKPFGDAITLIDPGSLDPSGWESLRGAVEAAAGGHDPPAHVEVRVRSFRVVFVNPQHLGYEAEQRTYLKIRASEDAGLGDQLRVLLFGLPLELLANAPFQRTYPVEAAMERDGMTCRLRADVRTAWTDGRTRTATIRESRHVEMLTDLDAWSRMVAATVPLTVRDFEVTLREVLGSTPPQPTGSPGR